MKLNSILMNARQRMSYGHNYEQAETGWSLADHPTLATLSFNEDPIPEIHIGHSPEQMAKWKMDGMRLPIATRNWLKGIWGAQLPKNVNETLSKLQNEAFTERKVNQMLTRNAVELRPGHWVKITDEEYFLMAQAQRATKSMVEEEVQETIPWDQTPDDYSAVTSFMIQRGKDINTWTEEQAVVRKAARHGWKENTHKKLVEQPDGTMKRQWVDAHAHELPPLTLPPVTIKRGAITKKMTNNEWMAEYDELIDAGWNFHKRDEGWCHEPANYVMKLPDGTLINLARHQGKHIPAKRQNPETALQTITTRLGRKINGGDHVVMQTLLERNDIIPAYTTYWQDNNWLVIAAWQRDPKKSSSRWTRDAIGNLRYDPCSDEAPNITVSDFEYAILSGAKILKDVNNRFGEQLQEEVSTDWIEEDVDGATMDFDELTERDPESDDDREEFSMEELEPEEAAVIWTLSEINMEMIDINDFANSHSKWDEYYEMLLEEGRKTAREHHNKCRFAKEMMGKWLRKEIRIPTNPLEKKKRWAQLVQSSKWFRNSTSGSNIHLRKNILTRMEGSESPLDYWRSIMKAFKNMTKNVHHGLIVKEMTKEEKLAIKDMAKWNNPFPNGVLGCNPGPIKTKRAKKVKETKYTPVFTESKPSKKKRVKRKDALKAEQLLQNPKLQKAIRKMIRKELEAEEFQYKKFLKMKKQALKKLEPKPEVQTHKPQEPKATVDMEPILRAAIARIIAKEHPATPISYETIHG